MPRVLRTASFFIQYQANVDFKATEELGLEGEFCQAGKCLSTGIKYSELRSWCGYVLKEKRGLAQI